MRRLLPSGFIAVHALRSNSMAVDTQLKNRLNKAGHFFGWYVKYNLGHNMHDKCTINLFKKNDSSN